MMDAGQERYLRDAVRRNLKPMQESAIFMALWTDNYERDAVACLQFGLAVLLDKPIYILMPKGKRLVENVRRLARAVEEYESMDDYEYAAKRLLSRAQKDGVLRDGGRD